MDYYDDFHLTSDITWVSILMYDTVESILTLYPNTYNGRIFFPNTFLALIYKNAQGLLELGELTIPFSVLCELKEAIRKQFPNSVFSSKDVDYQAVVFRDVHLRAISVSENGITLKREPDDKPSFSIDPYLKKKLKLSETSLIEAVDEFITRFLLERFLQKQGTISDIPEYPVRKKVIDKENGIL